MEKNQPKNIPAVELDKPKPVSGKNKIESEELAVLYDIIKTDSDIAKRNADVVEQISSTVSKLDDAQALQGEVIKLLSQIEHIFIRETDDIAELKQLIENINSQRNKVLEAKKFEIDSFVEQLNKVMNKKVLDSYVSQIEHSSITIEASAKMLSESLEETSDYTKSAMQNITTMIRQLDGQIGAIKAHSLWERVVVFSMGVAVSSYAFIVVGFLRL